MEYIQAAVVFAFLVMSLVAVSTQVRALKRAKNKQK